MNNVNDSGLLVRTGSYWIAPPSKAVIQTTDLKSNTAIFTFFRAIKNILLPNSRILLRKRFGHPFANFKQYDEWQNNPKYEKDSIALDIEMIEGSYRSSLLSFVKVAKVWGIEPILMTQFNRITVSDKKVKESYQTNTAPLPFLDFIKTILFV